MPPVKVLVVDDDRPTVDLIAEVLDDEGYRVQSVYDGSRMLAAVEAERPDIILLDLRMPGIKGVDLFRLLYQRGLATMPIILMTADANAMQQLVSQGVKFILLKPFDLETLLNCISQALQEPRETQDQGVPLPAHGDADTIAQQIHVCK